jgi:hypothetical protein
MGQEGKTEKQSKIHKNVLVLANWFAPNNVKTDNKQKCLQGATNESRPGGIFAWQDQE